MQGHEPLGLQEKSSKGSEHVIGDVLLDASQGGDDWFSERWRSLAEGYEVVDYNIHLHVRIRDEGTPQHFCAILYASRSLPDVLGGRSGRGYHLDALVGRNDYMEFPMLVDVAESVENPERVPLIRRVPSVMRLQRFDYCLRVWMNPPDFVREFGGGRGTVTEDGELRTSGDLVGKGGGGMFERKVVGKMVETRPEVIKTFSDSNVPHGLRVLAKHGGINALTRSRFFVLGEDVGLRADPTVHVPFDAIQFLNGMVVLRAERHGD
jgi:hypothetical protein